MSTLLLFLQLTVFSQSDLIKDSSNYSQKKYVVWYSPSKATHVYGLMFNFWAIEDGSRHKKYPKINGVEINISPLGIIYPMMLFAHSIIPQPAADMWPEVNTDTLDFKSFKKINGLQIGLANLESSVINGLDINVSESVHSKVNGVTISAILNRHYIMNGLTISFFGNHDSKCNGVQIGLYNTCSNLTGIQIGLWNKNQKRSLPFINWCFKK